MKLVHWLVFILGIVFVIVYFLGVRPEGFESQTSYDRNNYIQEGKLTYNPFSETSNVQTRNFANSNDPDVIKQANTRLASAFQTSDIQNSNTTHTLLGVRPAISKSTLAPPTKLFDLTKQCETLLTRESCASLDDPNFSNCGICIKGGSPFTFDNPTKHIGGLLLLPSHKLDAEKLVAGTSSQPKYTPSIGDCPDGYFFASRDECEKQVNRLDCAEAGASGGFHGGATIEGKRIVEQKCAQVINADNVFIYDPKSRMSAVNLRVLHPIGSGTCEVIVYDSSKKQVAMGQSNTPGKEFVLTITNVQENENLIVTVSLEAPYRYGSNQELYQIQFPTKFHSANDAASVCRRYASKQASMADLQNAWSQIQNGSEVCNPGWTTDGGLAYLSQGACGPKGVQQSSDTQGDVWCVGLRPPQSENAGAVTIANWNNRQVSMYLPPNETPSQRAILLQWEMAYGNSIRNVGFDSTILNVDGSGPSNVISGVNIFSNLRTFGKFATSTVIQNPRYNSQSKLSGDRVWLWTNRPLNQQAVFTVTVPGIFLDSFYQEDYEASAYGPLAGTRTIANMIKKSPCDTPGQAVGSYNHACLESTFVAAGGDLNKGTLVTQNGGVTKLNSIGSIYAISEYLNELYTIATTGKDSRGNLVGTSSKDTRDTINDASQKMFGFPIATPCENITQTVLGNIVIVPQKESDIDAWCLDYLWTNTGSELEHGNGDRTKKIKHTYTSIENRYSGLRSTEGTPTSRTQSPFTLCQRSGMSSPISTNGNINNDAMKRGQSLGTIADIQNYYNSIFNLANNNTSSEHRNTAIEQCYGLTK